MYLTFYKATNTIQLPEYDNIMQTDFNNNNEHYKITTLIEQPIARNELTTKAKAHITTVETTLKEILEKYLVRFEHNYEQQYYTFKIPKHSGGLRTINAPNPEFKAALTTTKNMFENAIRCLPHCAAYAYIKNRSIVDALTKHQANNSNWYLKIDLQDFFTSCTPELIYEKLMLLYPFYYIDKRSQDYLKRIIKICCLNGGLPQGTPMSPLLTNLVMVPYDYTLSNALKRGTGEHFVYTRYADDILISCKADFDWKALVNILSKVLTPFKIKTKKTRYGSKAGSNWNLGLMLNKDNNITLGSNKKRILNAMLNNFIRDYINKNPWNREDTYTLQGQLSWLKHIEPNYYNYIVQKYEAKYNIADYRDFINAIIY